MAQRYSFISDSGSVFIPVDETGITEDMSLDFETGQVIVAFYDGVDGSLVTPGAGTMLASGSPIDGQWLETPDGTIDATLVTPGDATYTPSTFTGPMERAKIVPTGITTATHYKAYIWRS